MYTVQHFFKELAKVLTFHFFNMVRQNNVVKFPAFEVLKGYTYGKLKLDRLNRQIQPADKNVNCHSRCCKHNHHLESHGRHLSIRDVLLPRS